MCAFIPDAEMAASNIPFLNIQTPKWRDMFRVRVRVISTIIPWKPELIGQAPFPLLAYSSIPPSPSDGDGSVDLRSIPGLLYRMREWKVERSNCGYFLTHLRVHCDFVSPGQCV